MIAKETEFSSILVIDDNKEIHRDFKKIFAPRNSNQQLDELAADLFGEEQSTETSVEFDLKFALQGKDGLEILKELHANDHYLGLAFVDMRMPPGWDGVQTIEELWKVDPSLLVVICTAYSDRSWHEIFERLGNNDQLLILKKPFDSIEVTQIATSLREKRRLYEVSKSCADREQDANEMAEPFKDISDNVRCLSRELAKLDSILSELPTLSDSGIRKGLVSTLVNESGESFDPERLQSTLGQISVALEKSVDAVDLVSKSEAFASANFSSVHPTS